VLQVGSYLGFRQLNQWVVCHVTVSTAGICVVTSGICNKALPLHMVAQRGLAILVSTRQVVKSSCRPMFCCMHCCWHSSLQVRGWLHAAGNLAHKACFLLLLLQSAGMVLLCKATRVLDVL